MPQLRLALAQFTPAVDDPAGSSGLITAWTRRAAARGAHLVVFPAMPPTGGPDDDPRTPPSGAGPLAPDALARHLSDAGLGELPVVVGHLGGPAVLLHRGRAVLRTTPPGRFDARGAALPVFTLHGVDIALACRAGLRQGTGGRGAQLVVAPDAAPLARGGTGAGPARYARQAGAALAVCHAVGCRSGRVHDGASSVFSRDGELLARAGRFDEELLTADLTLPAATTALPGRRPAVQPWRMVPGIPDAEPAARPPDRVLLSSEPLRPYPPLPLPRPEPHRAPSPTPHASHTPHIPHASHETEPDHARAGHPA